VPGAVAVIGDVVSDEEEPFSINTSFDDRDRGHVVLPRLDSRGLLLGGVAADEGERAVGVVGDVDPTVRAVVVVIGHRPKVRFVRSDVLG